jgi:uncharacterized protein (TIGR02996 family)
VTIADDVAAGNFAAALDAALDWWRQTRAPECAALVDAIAAKLPPRRALGGANLAARAQSWNNTLAKHEAGDVPRVVAAIASRSWEEATERLGSLLTWPADPRLAAGVLALLNSSQRPRPPTAEAVTAVLRLVGELRDVRAIDKLASLALDGALRDERDAVVRSLRSVRPTWDDADRAQAAQVTGLLGAHAHTNATDDRRFAELIEAVLADEASDGPRLVLADWLTERGHPQGQLIAAQLGGQEQRVAGLLRKHRAAILGPFEAFAVKNTIVFERGLLHALVIAITPDAERVRRSFGDARWRTVRQLDVTGEGNPPLLAELLTHPSLARLTAFSPLDDELIDLLSAHGPRPSLSRLTVYGNPNLDRFAATFPSLTSLRALIPAQVLYAHPLAAQLVELQTAHTGPPSTKRLLDAPPNLRRLTIGGIYGGDREPSVTLTRTDGGPFQRLELGGEITALSTHNLRYTLQTMLSVLPRGSLKEFVTPPALANEYAAELSALRRA